MSSTVAISKLADELLLGIFKLSVEEAYLRWHHAFPIEYPTLFVTTPFTLAAVSKGWRALCLANTSVWDTIYIRFPAYEHDFDDNLLIVTAKFIAYVDALQLWIERAGERNLSISLELQEPNMSVDFADESATRIPNLILGRATQLKHLEVVLSAKWYPLFNGVEFPILEKLRLWTPEMWPADGIFDEIYELERVEGGPLDLTSCPHLSFIEMCGSYRDHSRVILPWTQIRTVHADWIRPLVYSEILDLMPNIERCTLSGDAMYETVGNFLEEDAARFEVMKRRKGEWMLEELKVVGMDRLVIKALLDYSPLSLKRILCLIPDGRSHHIDDPTFLQSITPFAATLNNLTIHWYFLNDFDSLADALIQLNSLVSLQVRVGTEDRGLDDDFLSRTLCKSEVLPSLKTLAIRTTELQFTWDIFKLVLSKRGYPKDTLEAKCEVIQDLELTGTEPNGWFEPVTPERAALLKGCLKEGLRLTIGYVRTTESYGKAPLSPWFHG